MDVFIQLTSLAMLLAWGHIIIICTQALAYILINSDTSELDLNKIFNNKMFLAVIYLIWFYFYLQV